VRTALGTHSRAAASGAGPAAEVCRPLCYPSFALLGEGGFAEGLSGVQISRVLSHGLLARRVHR